MTTDEVVNRPVQSTERWILPLITVMLAFPALRVLGVDSGKVGLSLLVGVAAYVVAIYLFYGIARLSYLGHWNWLGIGIVGGAILGAIVGGVEHLWFTQTGWLAVLVPGILVGYLLKRTDSSFRVYLGGLIALILLSIAAWFPTWLDVYRLGTQAGDEMVKMFVGGLNPTAYSPEQVEQITEMYKMLVRVSVRLTPASTIVSAIVQFSLGFLWLTWRLGQTDPVLGKVRRFTEWKVPFGLTPAFGLVIVARLVGNDAIQVIADNALLVMAVFYAVCGLSFMEHTLHRVKVSFFIRILFYVLLFLTHVAGLLMMVLVGFVDSFLDWRKLTTNVTVEQ